MTIHNFPIPKEILQIARKIKESGKKTYVVGGALRDFFINRQADTDFDLASDASPEEIIALFPRVIPTGLKHGTVTVLTGRYSVEITTLRTEKSYSDGRRPDEIQFVADIESDLSRRDFTMNAMACELPERTLYDPFKGIEDIKRGLIRSVGQAATRFAEDGLRSLRALRFAAQLGFEIDADTFAAIPGAISTFRKVSMERIRDELEKIILSHQPAYGLGLMESSGLLFEVIPELRACRGCAQKGAHRFDVLDHLYVSVEAAMPDIIIRLAALLHDIGKPAAKTEDSVGVPSFHNHERISAKMAEKILRRLKFSNEVIDSVTHLVGEHMFNYSDEWTDAAVRRFVARVGKNSIESLFALRMADSTGTAGVGSDPRTFNSLRTRIEAVLAGDSALGVKDLAIDGNDLASLGVPRGPVMGKILADLLETVLDDPAQNEPVRLKRIALELARRYGLEPGA